MRHRLGRPHVVQRLLLGLVVLFAAMTGFALWCAHSEAGRDFTARRIERLVSSNIPGRLEIGKITSIRGSRVHGYDVRFFHEDGRCLLWVQEAEVHIDVPAAFGRVLSFHSIEGNGGFMVLSIDPDGRLSFEAAVNSKRKPGQPVVYNSGVHYSMRDMHVENFRLLVEPDASSKTQYEIRHVSGTLSIDRSFDDPRTHVTLRKFRGELVQQILGQRLRITRLDGWVQGEARQVAEGLLALRIDEDTLRARVEYWDRKNDKLKVRIERKDGVAATTSSWLLNLVDEFSSQVSVDG